MTTFFTFGLTYECPKHTLVFLDNIPGHGYEAAMDLLTVPEDKIIGINSR